MAVKLTPSRWHCEYRQHVRITDYLNIMVNNFPLLTWRRYDYFNITLIHSIHSVAFLGMTFNAN